MKLGYFDDANREYVVSVPKTPYPWINYLGNESFFSLISNTGGGYTFYKDAKFRRITRYRYNNVPTDTGGKYFYIREGNEVWSPAWKPAKTALDAYECRHGLGYSTITGERNKLKCSTTYFVPLGFNAEVQMVTLKNESEATKNFRFHSFIEWCLWNAEDDMANFQRNFSTGEVEIDGSTIYHKTEYRERRNHYAFYTVNSDVSGYETDRDTFLGLGNGYDTPDTVFNGGAENSEAHGWSPIASHQLDIELAPGEEKQLVFVLGYEENNEDEKWAGPNIVNKYRAEATIAKLDTYEKAQAQLEKIKEYWEGQLAGYSIESDDNCLNRMVNIWNQYQCMVTFNFSRSASFFESGIGRGMGFRDSNQDLIGVLHMVPERARERILDIAATQLDDGSAYHQYQPLTKRGNAAIGGNFNDDPLWLLQSVTAYVKETGDFSILEASVPFGNDESNRGSLFEHLTRSFNYTINNLGPHGLPLIGRADWNDCLNLNCFSKDPNESFQTTENQKGGTAESVMIAGMFVYFGKEYIKLCKQLGKDGEAVRAQAEVDKMTAAVNEHGWDGDWFLRAYDAAGDVVGSKQNEDGKIFVESQGFCVMAGIGAEDGRAEKALESVNEHLACDYGIVLVYPAFKSYQLQLGEISTYPPGYKENGGIFCHNNPWIVIAETALGNGDRAFDYYTRVAPAYQKDQMLRKIEPYVYCQMVAGKEAFKPGEGKNSWLTGTAAWNYHAVTEHILGIKPDYDGLVVDPCIPKTLTSVTIERKFRGATYNITIKNPNGANKHSNGLTVNGEKVEGNKVPLAKEGEVCEILCQL